MSGPYAPDLDPPPPCTVCGHSLAGHSRADADGQALCYLCPMLKCQPPDDRPSRALSAASGSRP